MAEHTQTALNLLQILIAIGAFKGIEILIKYLINRKKNKTTTLMTFIKSIVKVVILTLSRQKANAKNNY